MNRADEAAKLARTTYERVQKLYDEGVLPVQKRDEAETQMNAANAQAEAARAQYTEATNGARAEDKDAANALVLQASGAKAEVKAYLDETKSSRRFPARSRSRFRKREKSSERECRLSRLPTCKTRGRFSTSAKTNSETFPRGKPLNCIFRAREKRLDGSLLHRKRRQLRYLEEQQGKRRIRPEDL